MFRNRRFHYRDCDSEKICYLCDAFLRFGWTCEFLRLGFASPWEGFFICHGRQSRNTSSYI